MIESHARKNAKKQTPQKRGLLNEQYIPWTQDFFRLARRLLIFEATRTERTQGEKIKNNAVKRKKDKSILFVT